MRDLIRHFEWRHLVRKGVVRTDDDRWNLIGRKMSKSIVNIVLADDLEPNGARASAGTQMTNFGICMNTALHFKGSNKNQHLSPWIIKLILWMPMYSVISCRASLNNEDAYNCHCHIQYIDVIMSAMASQLIGVSIVCSTVCSGADQRKRQSSASRAFVRESTGDRNLKQPVKVNNVGARCLVRCHQYNKPRCWPKRYDASRSSLVFEGQDARDIDDDSTDNISSIKVWIKKRNGYIW